MFAVFHKVVIVVLSLVQADLHGSANNRSHFSSFTFIHFPLLSRLVCIVCRKAS
jgi:hypothetical protein